MNKIKLLLARLFARKTNYKVKQISDKQKELLDLIDNKLSELHAGRYDGAIKVKMISVPLAFAMLPNALIFSQLNIEQGSGYIPRAVAFNVDTYGNWIFTYALREEVGSDEITSNLFIECLNNTNEARSE